jgi:hypothetical protein
VERGGAIEAGSRTWEGWADVQGSQESLSSRENEWSEYEGRDKSETSASWARRRELFEVVGEGREESANASGLVEGGRDLPKNLSAFKQAQWEEMMAEWGQLWRNSTKGCSLAALDLAHPPQPSPATSSTSLNVKRPSFRDFDSTTPTWARRNASSTSTTLAVCARAELWRRGSTCCWSVGGIGCSGRCLGRRLGVQTAVLFPVPFPLSSSLLLRSFCFVFFTPWIVFPPYSPLLYPLPPKKRPSW